MTDIVEELRNDRENGAKRLVEEYKAGLGSKIEKANKDLAEVKYEFKTN